MPAHKANVMNSAKQQLSENEAFFCELYVNGSANCVGNAARCYSEVFKPKDPRLAKQLGRTLLMDERIQEYIKELGNMAAEDNKSMKRFITANLMSIVEETSSATYSDRNGTRLSPASLRSVAVSAMKLLSDMYPVKESQANRLSIEGGDGSSITFNVIVPEPKKDTDKEE